MDNEHDYLTTGMEEADYELMHMENAYHNYLAAGGDMSFDEFVDKTEQAAYERAMSY